MTYGESENQVGTTFAFSGEIAMKIRTSILAIALGAATASMASADAIDFEGVIKFTSMTGACPGSVRIGSIMRSRFHPTTAMAPANGGWFGINRNGEMWSEAWGNWGEVSTSKFSKVNYGKAFDRFVGRTDDPAGSRASIRFNEMPTGLDTKTKFLEISGEIQNPFSLAAQSSCIVSFTGAYMNRKYVAP